MDYIPTLAVKCQGENKYSRPEAGVSSQLSKSDLEEKEEA